MFLRELKLSIPSLTALPEVEDNLHSRLRIWLSRSLGSNSIEFEPSILHLRILNLVRKKMGEGLQRIGVSLKSRLF